MKKLLLPVLSTAILITGCLATGPGKTSSCPGCPEALRGGDCEKNGFVITICSNHGHTVKEDMKKEGAFDYTLKGTAGHQHTLIINGGHYFRLQKGRGIQIISEATDGHTHTVTINCKK